MSLSCVFLSLLASTVQVTNSSSRRQYQASAMKVVFDSIFKDHSKHSTSRLQKLKSTQSNGQDMISALFTDSSIKANYGP